MIYYNTRIECGSSFCDEVYISDIKEAEEAAEENGWFLKNGEHYCPKCRVFHEEEEKWEGDNLEDHKYECYINDQMEHWRE